jgi:hypothetical protein
MGRYANWRSRRNFRHYLTHHECYYRPACLRCWVLAYIGVFVVAVRR